MSLAAIVVVAGVVRLAWLSVVPNGLFADEASSGYDAYSLLHTLRDQYGAWLPLYANSFGNYEDTLLRYLTVSSVAAFGLTEFATRLPSAIVGTLTTVVLFWLCALLFDRRVGLLAALLLAVMPWHVHFSRIAFGTILIPFCLSASVALFVKGLRQPRVLPLAAVGFAVTMHTYPAARGFVPIFVVGLALLCWRDLTKAPRWSAAAAGVLLLLAVPTVAFWLTPEGSARARVTLDPSLVSDLRKYLTYFGPQFLFWRGDPFLRHNVTGYGELYLVEALPIACGLWSLRHEPRPAPQILWLWTALYPIPAALTLTLDGHASRAIVGTPLFAILAALGFVRMLEKLPRPAGRWVAVTAAALLAVSVMGYAREYFIAYPQYSAADWQYGMREAVMFAESNRYDSVVLSDQFLLPHIFVLFYTRYPPGLYQASPVPGVTQNHWRYADYSLAKYSVESVTPPRHHPGRSLCIMPAHELPPFLRLCPRARVVRVIDSPAGKPSIVLAQEPS